MFDLRETDAFAALVAIVTVAVVPLAEGVTGLGALHVGSGELPPLTLQVSVTAELYPFSEIKSTVELAGPPGLTGAGVVAEMAKLAVVGSAYDTAIASIPPALVCCSAATVGKSVDAVLPVT